jgi:hypothetical protein
MDRFVEIDEGDLEQLSENRDSKNTKASIKGSVNIFKEYCSATGSMFSDVEQLPLVGLCSKLKTFYAAVRNRKGELYSKKSMINLRYRIQKHFLKVRDIDIVNHESFKAANTIFLSMLVKCKQEGKGVSIHKPPISVDDLKKMYDSFNLDSPTDLQNKVFIDFMLYLCNRGRENLKELKKEDFHFHGEGEQRYVTLRDHSTKNHRGDENDSTESQGGRMYVVPRSSMCPVQSLEKYMSVLNPECDFVLAKTKINGNKN